MYENIHQYSKQTQLAQIGLAKALHVHTIWYRRCCSKYAHRVLTLHCSAHLSSWKTNSLSIHSYLLLNVNEISTLKCGLLFELSDTGIIII